MRLTLTAPDEESVTIGLFGPGSSLNDDGLRFIDEWFDTTEDAKAYLRNRVPIIADHVPGYDTVAALAEIENGSLTINGLTAIIEE